MTVAGFFRGLVQALIDGYRESKKRQDYDNCDMDKDSGYWESKYPAIHAAYEYDPDYYESD